MNEEIAARKEAGEKPFDTPTLPEEASRIEAAIAHIRELPEIQKAFGTLKGTLHDDWGDEYGGVEYEIREILASEISVVEQRVRREERERIAQITEGFRMKEDGVCTHYQDNCSCYTARDVKMTNRVVNGLLAILHPEKEKGQETKKSKG